MSLMHSLLWTLVLLLCLSPHCHLTASEQPSGSSVLPLKPDVPVRHRFAPVSSDPLDNNQLFRLLDLKANSHYEVRVSFLGTVSCNATQHCLVSL